MPTLKSYGVTALEETADTLNLHVEELTIQGYTIVENCLDAEALASFRQRLDAVYAQQEAELGADLQTVLDPAIKLKISIIPAETLFYPEIVAEETDSP